MKNTTSRISPRNVTIFQKFINWKLKKFITNARQKTLLEMLLHLLVDQNNVYVKTVMKKHSYMHCLLPLYARW